MLIALLLCKGGPQNPGFIYKNVCMCSHVFKLQTPSEHSPPEAAHLSDAFRL